MSIKIKKEKLEEIINDEIDKLDCGFWESGKFTIHIEDNLEVQIIVTKDEDELIGKVLPRYSE